MRLILKGLATMAFCAGVHGFADPAQSASRQPRNVYVAEFVSLSLKEPALLASFTDQFETALVNSGNYKVLNRRNLNRVLAEFKSESYVASMNDLNSQARTRVPQVEGADGVVFGEVIDDVESGDITVVVTLEGFDSVKHWKRSVTMRRGLVRDGASRQAAMTRLVSGGSVSPSGVTAGTDAGSPTAGRPNAAAAYGMMTALKTDVERLTLSGDGRRASLVFRLENTGADPVHVALDNNGKLGGFAAANIMVSDNANGTWYVQSVSGLPVVRCCYRNLTEVTEGQFTIVAPGQRVQVTVSLNDDNGGVGTYRPYNSPGSYSPPRPTSFSFTAEALYFLASGAQRGTIRLPSVQPSR